MSRSFYLSIRFLPGPVRRPVSLAYLLARATDTVADVASTDAAVRLNVLERMGQAVAGRTCGALAGELAAIADGIDHEGEAALLRQWDALLAAYAASPAEEQVIIQRVIEEIVSGQSGDIQTFEMNASGCDVTSLADAAALERYTYQVAGCVGRFWTEILVECVGAKCIRGDVSQQVALGVEFGQGLQMINILRDLPEDLANGRCYLPADWQRDAGVSPDDPAAMWAAAEPWRRQCRRWVNSGIEYAAALRGVRLRFTAVLPALLAQETLEKLEQADWSALEARVKVSRRDVRRLMGRALGFALSGG
ncbi:phytoene/squalene synthase family protein [Sulfuriroseicoccus oceanibius]|uniref:Squalene/phytoene synthase family protein n=1 Tax=Sulfuriroseicoccus oceanibius TaxID=2707525 RepID=A0A6B3L7S6_9BACT|nr:phytoene/squalene synthase family protein [Sulfuriroseicoccus oceanibius]QQL43788.1 squalene/phytoene synthase family protein [Sulfuriroseicoccus oceanibius]